MAQMTLGDLVFSVLPPSVMVNYAGQHERMQLLSGEEVALARPPKLFVVEFESYFPAGETQGAAQIQRMFSAQQPVQFVLSGALLSFNSLVLVDGFSYWEKGGATEEIGYSLRLLEYRSFGIEKRSNYRSEPEFPYVVEQNDEIVHTVVWGDTLWALAKRYLGDATRYPEIAAYNNIPNPNVIYVGQVIRIP